MADYKDRQIRSLNDEISNRDELIGKLNKDKKQLLDSNRKAADDLQALEDKVTSLTRMKTKLEQTINEMKESTDREMRYRGEAESSRRKTDRVSKESQGAVLLLEQRVKELERAAQMKDKDMSSLSSKLEDGQRKLNTAQRQTKELQSRIDELEDEVDHARRSARIGRSRALFSAPEDDPMPAFPSADQEAKEKRHEAEVAKLRRELEEISIKNEAAIASLRKKHNDVVSEMTGQIEQFKVMKAR